MPEARKGNLKCQLGNLGKLTAGRPGFAGSIRNAAVKASIATATSTGQEVRNCSIVAPKAQRNRAAKDAAAVNVVLDAGAQLKAEAAAVDATPDAVVESPDPVVKDADPVDDEPLKPTPAGPTEGRCDAAGPRSSARRTFNIG
jgi:hypothetical protein